MGKYVINSVIAFKAFFTSNWKSYLKTSLLGIAPHVFVVLSPIIDTINHNEGEVTVVDLLLEGLDQAGTISVL